jgi:nucleotide-binding universal stress UspA family protein
LRALFPLDGSPESLDSLERGLKMLSKPECTILVVVDKSLEDAPPELIERFELDDRDEIFPNDASALAVLHDARERIPKGVKLHFKIARGKVMDEILKESIHHDLLVMHTHKPRGFFHKAGAHAISKRAACDVLLLASHDDDPHK